MVYDFGDRRFPAPVGRLRQEAGQSAVDRHREESDIADLAEFPRASPSGSNISRPCTTSRSRTMTWSTSPIAATSAFRCSRWTARTWHSNSWGLTARKYPAGALDGVLARSAAAVPVCYSRRQPGDLHPEPHDAGSARRVRHRRRAGQPFRGIRIASTISAETSTPLRRRRPARMGRAAARLCSEVRV